VQGIRIILVNEYFMTLFLKKDLISKDCFKSTAETLAYFNQLKTNEKEKTFIFINKKNAF